ncbi:MAG: hypothetical protein U1F66_08350 [bacterium]
MTSLPLNSLRGQFNPAERAELADLSRETDPELYAEAVLNFAGRQEAAGKLAEAATIYSELLRSDALASVPRSGLHGRAQGRLDAILGRGTFGLGAEFALRHLARQVSDPAALLAMGVAGAVFRATRLATLARLSTATEAGFLTRGFGARGVASFLGFAAEAPAFTLTGRLASQALGREQDWSGISLGRDLASSYLFLGGLKLASWAGTATTRRLAGEGLLSESGRLFLQQGALLGGITLGHRLEEGLGLRASRGGKAALMDSLACLLQFQMAARLSAGWAAWERALDLRAMSLENGDSSSGGGLVGPIPVGLRPAYAAAAYSDSRPRVPNLFMMSASSEDGGGARSESPVREAIQREVRERVKTLRAQIVAEPPDSPRASRWIEEAEWLENAAGYELREFFSKLLNLQAFYSRNLSLVGKEGFRWLDGMQRRLAQEVQSGEHYLEFLGVAPNGETDLRLPANLRAPSTLREPAEQLPSVFSVNVHSAMSGQDLKYFRIEDLWTGQEVVSEGRVEEYRSQVRGRLNYPQAVHVGFDARRGRYFMLDGHHRSLAAVLEGRTHILGSQLRHFAVMPNPHRIADLRRVTREEFERFAALNGYGTGMSEAMLQQISESEWLEAKKPEGGGAEPARGGDWAEGLRRLLRRH